MLAGVALSDWEGRILASNPAFCNLVGYTEAELRGTTFRALIHPDDVEDNMEQLKRLARGDVKSLVFEARFVHRNGTPVWVRKLITYLPVEPEEVQQLFIVCIDITRRKRKEGELSESEARLKLALEAGGAGMWENPVETPELIVSERARRLFGLPQDIVLTREHLLAVTHPQDRPHVEAAWRATFETGAPFVVEMRCPQPDGTMRWLHSQAEIREIGGRRRLVGLVRDISRRKLAEEAADISRQRLQLALDAARLGWWLFDPLQRSASWDSRLAEIFGIAGKGGSADTVLERIVPEDRPVINDAARATLDPHATDRFFRCELRIMRGADIHWIEIYGMVTFQGAAEDHSTIVGTVADITERKHAEEQQQLSMRELSHRTKNLLSVVQSIANQTAAASPSSFVVRFSERVRALSANIDLLVSNEWRGVEIEALVRAQLAHFADLIGVRIMVGGPPLGVLPAAAQNIGMALHELATNAGKYGSLSEDHGSVAVAWRHDGEVMSIGWREIGGPEVRPPEREGFGTTIITTVVEQNTGGTVELTYSPEGVTWRLTCPAAKVLIPRALPATAADL
jgi:PAS domain S-box-containing protein